MKKLFLTTLFLTLSVISLTAQEACWHGSVASTYDGGDGTPENPYQIATPEQLALLAQQTNNGTGGDACYILTDDICLFGAYWKTIGQYQEGNSIYEAIGFTGVFDGNGHTISEMLVTDHYGNYAGGLFAYTDGATIKNLKIDDSRIERVCMAGFITAIARNTNISDCTVNGVASFLYSDGINRYGGIVGTLFVDNHENDTIFIRNCVNNASIAGYYEQNNRVAGIVPWMAVDSANVVVIENCVNNSDLYYANHLGGIVGYKFDQGHCIIRNCHNYGKIDNRKIAGGIMGEGYYTCIFENCVNHSTAYVMGNTAGGIVGIWYGDGWMSKCVNNASVTGLSDYWYTISSPACAGGIAGIGSNISNCYNTGDIRYSHEYYLPDTTYVRVGGIAGLLYNDGCYNSYNTGSVSISWLASNGIPQCGIMVGAAANNQCHNLYWLGDYDYPACGDSLVPENSCAFRPGATMTSWNLDEPQYGTEDLIEALNLGANDEALWLEDVNFINNGLPIIEGCEPTYPEIGAKWYYEIINANGSITYQYLECAADTTIGTTRPKVIVKSNTLYDKDLHTKVTHEYVYSENGIVYWWDKQSQCYTTLYNFNANVGDEWTIHVGNQSITMHVDEINLVEYEGNKYKVLTVSDDGGIFSGDIIYGIGHTVNFFPEKLLNNKDFNVDGIRCYWFNSNQIIQFGNVDCDEIYNNYNAIAENDGIGFEVYPNPTNGGITIKIGDNVTFQETSLHTAIEFEITNICGQTLMQGTISSENQLIDISNLENGMYFIKIGDETVKIIKTK